MFEVVAASERPGPDVLHAFSRHQALATPAALPLSAALLLSPRSDAGAVDVFLARCASSLTAFWHLLRGTDMDAAWQEMVNRVVTAGCRSRNSLCLATWSLGYFSSRTPSLVTRLPLPFRLACPACVLSRPRTRPARLSREPACPAAIPSRSPRPAP